MAKTTVTTADIRDASITDADVAAANKDGAKSTASMRTLSASAAAAIGTAAAGAAVTGSSSDHVHATGAGTPSTQAFSDAAAIGSGPAAAMTDHKHAMPALGTGATNAAAGNDSRLSDSRAPTAHGASLHNDITRLLYLGAMDGFTDSSTLANIGSTPDLTRVLALANAATQGAFWAFAVPDDWASGAITVQPVWSPGSTDATPHTVRWTYVAKAIAAGSTVTAAGTTVAWTGSSAARTAGVVVYDTATSTTLTPAAAGDLFRINVQRIGADGADTYVGVVNLIGILVSYTANQ